MIYKLNTSFEATLVPYTSTAGTFWFYVLLDIWLRLECNIDIGTW
jgi:hypothetical protein